MTGGTVVVLGPVGANFGAGMTGGRAYLYDPTAGTSRRSTRGASAAVRLADGARRRPDGQARVIELIRLLEAHRDGRLGAGRPAARRRPTSRHASGSSSRSTSAPVGAPVASVTAERAASQPDRNLPAFPFRCRRPDAVVPSLEPNMGWCHPRVTRRRASPRQIHATSRQPQPGRCPPMIHPSDSRDPPRSSPSAMAATRRSPARRAAVACRPTGEACFHFNPLGGRDARGCRVDCADAAHDAAGRAIAVAV